MDWYWTDSLEYAQYATWFTTQNAWCRLPGRAFCTTTFFRSIAIVWPISHTLRKMGHIKLIKYPHCISWCPHYGWIGKSPIQMDKSPIFAQDFPWLLATETNGDASTTASRMHWKRNPTQQKHLWSIPDIHQENRSLNKYELIVRLQSEYISIINHRKRRLHEYHHQIGIIIRKMFRTNH